MDVNDTNNTTPIDNNQNPYNNFNQNIGGGGQITLPNSVGVLVLGILSIVLCWCYGIIAIALGIISIVLASGANKLYLSNPNAYTLASYKNMKAGRICAIIGISCGALFIVYIIIMVAIFGTLAFNLARMGALH